LVGLVIPFVAVVGGVAVLGRFEFRVAGIPIVYFWVFLWFVLTTVCLAASWYLFDRKDFEEEEESGENQRAEREI
jgi:nitrate/nitrite transporter NarK